MSWWWENLDSENVYPVYASLGAILNRTGWGRGAWTNIGFRTTGAAPPTVGDPIPGGQPFDAFLSLSGLWGGLPAGQLAIPDPAAAADSASSLNSFVQGVWHADLKAPFRLSAWLTNNARLVMHLNSVSDGSIMVVRADGTELFRTNLANLDGAYTLDNEYNLDIPINLPAGKRLIEITNAGNDWFFLDWVRLEQVLPATYVSGWLPSPDSIGLRGPHESLVYVVAPGAAFPSGATNVSLPLQSGQTVTLTNWPAGEFNAEWYDPSTGARIGSSQARTTNALLTLALPGIREDVAGIIYPPPGLTALGLDGVGGFQMRLDSESGGHYAIEQSSDFTHWTPWRIVTNDLGVVQLTVPSVFANPRTFFRARQTE
jgi:hypothetical protein